MKRYNSWPLGKLEKRMQRQEPFIIKEQGYEWDDPRDILGMFENKVAEYAGAKYAVAVDCCSHAIFLSLKYLLHKGEIGSHNKVFIPKRTYVSVPMEISHAGLIPVASDVTWNGYYRIQPTRVIDAAVIWERDMYVPDSLMCLSFQLKKAVPIGKGGMVLINDKEAADWIRLASYDGRDLNTAYDSEDHVKMVGWHYYMTPEDAARGIILMDMVEDKGRYLGNDNYPDVEQMLKNIK